MQKQQSKLRELTQLSLLIGIMIIMSFTPLGYIPLGFMRATTMHIPVILGGCIFGVKKGAFLGGVFGITSVIKATVEPTITSFVFTPFYSLNEQFSGSVLSLVVAILPRIFIGVFAALVFNFITKFNKNISLAFLFAGLVGSMVNTVGVMGLIGLFFGEDYSAATGGSIELLFGAILSIVALNGVPEAIIAAVCTLAIGKALLAINLKKT